MNATPFHHNNVQFNRPPDQAGFNLSVLADQAQQRIGDQIPAIRVFRSEALSTALADVLVADLTEFPGGSYKYYGALNGVTVAVESGNKVVGAITRGGFGNSLVAAARMRDVRPQVHVPESATDHKKTLLRKNGADLHEHSGGIEETALTATREMDEAGIPSLHAYKSPYVLAGHMLLTRQLARRFPDADAVVTPAGGGGLAAAFATAYRERYAQNTSPWRRLVISQVAGNTAFVDALQTGNLQHDRPVNTDFEGLAVGTSDCLNLALTAPSVWLSRVATEAEAYRALYDVAHDPEGKLAEAASGPALANAAVLARLATERTTILVPLTGINYAADFPEQIEDYAPPLPHEYALAG